MKILPYLIMLLGLLAPGWAQDYGPFYVGPNGGSVTFDVATGSGRLLLTPISSGGGTGGHNEMYSTGVNGASIQLLPGYEAVSFSGISGLTQVAAVFYWVSLSEDGSWGYVDVLNVYVNVAAPVSYQLTTDFSGSGSVSGGGSYPAGTTVTVTASPAAGYYFAGWQGALGGSGNPATVTLDADKSVTAVFQPAPPVQFSLTTSAGPGGTVTPGGSYDAGTVVYISAAPDGTHDFAGWSGDAGGSANPLGIAMDGNRNITAGFSPKFFPLTTNASAGGSVTPGGTYSYGTTVTIAATPDATHFFNGWTGDAGGMASSIAVLLDRAKSVQALFAPKAAQTISFTPPGDQNVGAALPLTATSSSGLPVSFVVLGGPATFSNGTLTVTGPGPITIQAVQPGDAYTLAAPPVTGTFNAAAPAVLKYHAAARTLLQTDRTAEAANYVLSNP